MHTYSPNKPKMLKQTLSARKLMITVFWDRKGELMVEFMQQGATIMSEVYYETLKKNCLGPAMQNRRCGMLTSTVVLLHDNAHLHTAARTRILVEHFNWDLFDHPPYSSDLDLSSYHLPEELVAITALQQ
jgi:hypothetical protein